MPCYDGCNNTTNAQNGALTCTGALKARIGTCTHPTDCAGVSYPVGHYVRINEYPTKGVGNYVYAYYADNCADNVSEVGLLGAEQCQLKRGISVILKHQKESALFYGAVAKIDGIVPGTEIMFGYTDKEGKFWTLWSAGEKGGEIGVGSGEIELGGVEYTTGLVSKPIVMPDDKVFGAVIGAGNDAGTSIGVLFATLPGATPETMQKIGVYGSPVYNAGDTTVAMGAMFTVRDSAGANIAGTSTVLGYASATVRRAAIFNGRIELGIDGRITRDAAAVGELYLEGETLKVRIS